MMKSEYKLCLSRILTLAKKFRCSILILRFKAFNIKVMIDINLLFLVKFSGNFMLEISKILFWFGEIILSGGIKFLSAAMKLCLKFGYLKGYFACNILQITSNSQ